MNELLAQLSKRLGASGTNPSEYMRWVQASVGATIRMIPTSDILFFRAEDKYTRVQTRGFEALIRKPIKELIDELDPDEFWQIHRSTVVRVDAVDQVSRDFRGRQIVHLKGSEEKLEVNVLGGLTVDQGQIGLAAVRDGAGLMYVAEPMVRKDLRDGTLRTVLDDWAPLGPGFHIYYSSRRQVPAALRLFIDLVRELRPLGL